MKNSKSPSQEINQLRQELETLKHRQVELETLLATREQQLKALQDKETLLQVVLDNIPQLIFWKDRNSVFQGCNRKWAKASGLQHPDQVMGKTDYELFPNANSVDIEQYLEKDRQVIDSGQFQSYLEYKPNKDAWYETRKIPIRDGRGTIVGILATIEDISDRKKAEEALRLAEQKYRSIFENALEGIFQSTAQGQFISVNPALAHIYGYDTPAKLMAAITEIKTQTYVEPSCRDNFEKLMQEQGEVKGLQYQVYQRNGQVIWVEENTRAIRDDRSQTVYYEGIIQDITQRKQAEQVLAEYNRTLETEIARRTQALKQEIKERKQTEKALIRAKKLADAANQAKSTFIANMNHELRTPLNAIIGFAQLLSRDPSLNADQQQQLNIITHSGEHLLALINSILEMSKIESGRMTIEETHFDLYHLLSDLQNMFRLRTQAKGLELIFEIADPLPQYVVTDERKLRQVLINLLGNAVKFTHVGKVTLKVCQLPSQKKTKKTQGIHLEFVVEDTGPGIAIGELDKVFIPFEQTQTGRNTQGGTGLGLPISRKFVQMLGGEMDLSSTVGVGTRLIFDITLGLGSPQDVVPQPPMKKVIALAPHQPDYRILVVDDRPESRLLLVKLLSCVGFTVWEASNGKEAIAIWQSWQPHLIWMDMRMPVMDGYEATEQIKSHPQGQTTVIIALTASAFEEDRAIILSAGCDDFVRKPFQEADIWGKLSKYLGVEYLYESPEASLGLTSFPVVAENASVSEIMPTEWLDQLYQVAMQLNRKKIFQLIEQIPPSHAPLAEQLRQLAQDYRFDKIAEIAKQESP